MKTVANPYGELRARWAMALVPVVGRDLAFQAMDVLEHTMPSSALEDLAQVVEQAGAHGIRASEVRPQLQRRALLELTKVLADEPQFLAVTKDIRRVTLAGMRAAAERLRAART